MNARNHDDAAAPHVSVIVSVIVPAYNCQRVLEECLRGLLASDLPREKWELIVVDDGSTDATPEVAAVVADRVLSTASGPRGPGEARNVGASAAAAPILLFVDADVVVAPVTLSGFVRVFASSPDVAAVFGSYDDRPAHEGFLSQYRNLLHHYVHSTGAFEASTFWAGCGAVRREQFLEAGGYDTNRYPRPQIEDIELGYRLKDRGYRIRLSPDLQGKHLKRWSLWNMVRTDLRDRAIPWMHLLIDRREVTAHGPLNLQHMEKVLTVVSTAGVLSLGLAIATWSLAWLLLALVCVGCVVLGNLTMLRWFRQRRGTWFALRVVPVRLLFYVLSGTGAAWAIFTHRFQTAPSQVTPLRDRHDPVTAS